MKTTIQFTSAIRKADCVGDILTYHPSRKIFVCEASDIGLRPGVVPEEVLVKDIHTGKSIEFSFDDYDTDGFRYVSENGKFPTTLLIIND